MRLHTVIAVTLLGIGGLLEPRPEPSGIHGGTVRHR